ncbi:hypothetical protein CROQUDRAFT_651135 [Cronartium quercuum f. sp. fusiforme G11]|uniref:Uncharacterized protein n=1 Tax=Cronartium quercuum f. sp. fusiforme G11 TaxID=708437 RepID=A0A9P6NSC6_9BASI|nr:hypothetical protein CROQUDRAFT_651135 [Cronartium quercuum f. sp. fusiforme G11]
MAQISNTMESFGFHSKVKELVNCGKSANGTVHWTCPFCKLKSFTSWEALNRHTTNCWPKPH